MTRLRSALAMTILSAVGIVVLGATSDPEVKTEAGTVRGKSDGTISAFLGIPYAAPPVGDLRWKPPTPVAKWTGVRNTTSFASRCMQGPIYSDMVFRDPGISEDCLALNVWTPSNQAKGKLPVMVWIYGGGFAAGATSEPRQDGTNLAKQGVVVVSMNYRLDIFGFFVHPDLAAESGRNSAGNYGLLDQVAALEWVHRNIAAFGGDPQNVTIFGESAGSFSVSALMASPVAKGLFQKAIGESGAAFFSSGLRFGPMTAAAEQDARFASDTLKANTVTELRAVPAQKLLDAVLDHNNKNVPRFVPDVDGYFLPERVPTIFAAGRQNDVPLLAGWNKDEGSFEVVNARERPSPASMRALAGKEFDGRGDEFLKLYPSENDEQALRSMQDFAGDRFIAWSTWKWLEMQKDTGKQPVYRYRFDVELPNDPRRPPGVGAFHSAEIEYVFGVLDSNLHVNWRTEDRQVSEQMQKYWTNFARSGDPNGPGLPQWPKYESATGWMTMHLDAPTKAEKDSLRDRYLFLDSMWTR